MKITIECCGITKTFEGGYTVGQSEQEPFDIFRSDDDNTVIQCEQCQRRIKLETYKPWF